MDVRARIGSGKYDMTVSMYQALVLLLFNEEEESHSVRSLQLKTGIPGEELKRALVALAFGKHRILLRGSKATKVIESDDIFSVNPSFSSRSVRVKLPLVVSRKAALEYLVPEGDAASAGAAAAKEEAQQRQEDEAKIREDRRFLIDATVVRIMKHRRTLDHNGLVAECAAMLAARFRPDVGEIKRRIEILIDKEYLRRHADNRQVYQYVA